MSVSGRVTRSEFLLSQSQVCTFFFFAVSSFGLFLFVSLPNAPFHCIHSLPDVVVVCPLTARAVAPSEDNDHSLLTSVTFLPLFRHFLFFSLSSSSPFLSADLEYTTQAFTTGCQGRELHSGGWLGRRTGDRDGGPGSGGDRPRAAGGQHIHTHTFIGTPPSRHTSDLHNHVFYF